MKHYIIGDVHGHYKTLLALVEKLPDDAKLVFVGDLVDRGPMSMEVVRFVQEGEHLCVMGNHEELMVRDGTRLLKAYDQDNKLNTYCTWFRNGGVATTRSYGVTKLVDGRPVKVDDQKVLERFREDIEWMKSLPLYIELEVQHISEKPVVVSHAPIATVWNMRNVDPLPETFIDMALWNRRTPDEDAKIFNIFGHTPIAFGVEIEDHYVNVDTGCYLSKNGYHQLSAYCVETGEVVSVNECE